MILKPIRIVSIAACALIAQANVVNAKDTPPAREPKKEAKPAAVAPDAQPDLGMNRIGEALQALSAAKDEEALKMIEGARQNEGKMGVTKEQASKLIQKAIDQGLIPAKAEASGESDAVVAGKVLAPLAEKGDAYAKELLEKAKANGGKLGLTQEEIAKVLASAKEQGLLPKASGAEIGKAIQALAAAGDAEAKAKLEDAKSKGGKLEITPADAEKFVAKAKAQGLLK